MATCNRRLARPQTGSPLSALPSSEKMRSDRGKER
jgi:hypothetical protein